MIRIIGTLLEDQYKFLIITCSILIIMKNIQINFRESQNTDFKFNTLFFRKPCLLWDNVEKYCRAEQATDDSDACTLHVGYISLQTCIQNMW